MELYNRILKLVPTVNPDDFRLTDNSDGKGPFISRWDSDLTQPTKEEISSVDDSKPTWIATQEEIARLESTITPRRLRDALANDEGKVWVAAVELKIKTERAKL